MFHILQSKKRTHKHSKKKFKQDEGEEKKRGREMGQASSNSHTFIHALITKAAHTKFTIFEGEKKILFRGTFF